MPAAWRSVSGGGSGIHKMILSGDVSSGAVERSLEMEEAKKNFYLFHVGFIS